MSETDSSDAPARAESPVNVVRPTASYRVFSWTAFTHANVTCVCHMLTTILVFLKLSGDIHGAWAAIFIPEWIFHVVVRMYCQYAWFRDAGAWVDAQLGPPPPDTASTYMHMRYADKRARRMDTHRTEILVAAADGAAVLVVKILVVYLLQTGLVFNMPFSWALAGIPLWVVWPVGMVVHLRKPTASWRLCGLRDIMFGFAAMLAAKLDGAPFSWAVTFAVPWVTCGILMLLALVWSGYLAAIVMHPTYTVKLPQLAWGVSACFAAPALQFPAFLYAAWLLDGVRPVTLQQVFIPSIMSWACCVAAANTVAFALRRQEADRARRIAAGQAWTAHPEAADLASERSHVDRQLFAMPEDELVSLVQSMMLGGAMRPQYLMRVGEHLWRPMEEAGALPGGASTAAQLAQRRLVRAVRGAGVHADTAKGPGTQGAGSWLRQPGSDQLGPQEEGPDMEQGPDDPDVAGSEVHVVVVLAGAPSGAPQAGLQEGAQQGVASGRPQEEQGGDGGDGDVLAGRPDKRRRGGEQQGRRHEQPGSAGSPAAVAGTAAGAMADASASQECVLCFNAPPTSVLLGCGHGGFCRRCAHLVAVRPPRQCPTCRQPISAVVGVADASAPIGRITRVATP